MLIKSGIGPSITDLRRIAAPGENLPVHPGLTSELATAKTFPDDTVAHVLATLSGYAYSTEDTVEAIATRLGLAESHVRGIQQTVDAMFICSSAYLVQSADGRVVVLVYRGTEPLNFLSWLTDYDVYPDLVELRTRELEDLSSVHAGFYRNTAATRDAVLDALRAALRGESVHEPGRRMGHRMEVLYLTGHSLGGAMAVLMAVLLHAARRQGTDEELVRIAERLRAVYTFGQPMVGGPDFVRPLNSEEFFTERLIRYVHRRDVVPHLPPWGSGDFRHIGVEYHYDGSWSRRSGSTRQMPLLGGIMMAANSFVSRQHRLLRNLPYTYSFHDHGPHHYISALTPVDQPMEWGQATRRRA
jgi:hypothetical protein